MLIHAIAIIGIAVVIIIATILIITGVIDIGAIMQPEEPGLEAEQLNEQQHLDQTLETLEQDEDFLDPSSTHFLTTVPELSPD